MCLHVSKLLLLSGLSASSKTCSHFLKCHLPKMSLFFQNNWPFSNTVLTPEVYDSNSSLAQTRKHLRSRRTQIIHADIHSMKYFQTHTLTCVSDKVHIKGRPQCLLNVSTNRAWAPTHTCACHVCVCILRLVSLPLNTLVHTFIPVNSWHVCVRISRTLHARVCIWLCGLRVFYDYFFYCLFVLCLFRYLVQRRCLAGFH